MKFFSCLLFQRTCDFNVLLHSGRLFQQYLFGMFLEVDSERLPRLSQNQSKLRPSNYTHLCDLLANAANHENEITQWTGSNESKNALNVRRLVVIPPNHIGSDRYMQQKMHEIIAISNSFGHPDIFLTITCYPN